MAERWSIEHYKRLDGSIPGFEFLLEINDAVSGRLNATLESVRDATPYRWKSPVQFVHMKDQSNLAGVDMSDFHEVRDEHDGMLYRLFCIVERDPPGPGRPIITVVDGRCKPDDTGFSNAVYADVRALGKAYLKTNPRSVATFHDALEILKKQLAAAAAPRPRKAGKNKKKGKPAR